MSDKNFTIYKSSAGSGKTFTLVKEYLALALNDESNPPQAYKHILAITFTNKAAAEMKERIVRALKDLAAEDYSKITSGSKTLLGILKVHKKLNSTKQLDDAIIRKRAQNILTAILHNYSDFAIGTIDAFVHKVVRTFAFDLKIPMSFDIEMDDEKLLSQAIDLLIAQIGNDEKLTRALIEFTESKTDDEKSWHIEHDLMKFAKNLLNEEGAVYIEKLKDLSVDDFFKIRETLFTEIKKFENGISGIAKQADQLIKQNGLTAKQFYQGDKGIAGYFEKLSNGRMDYITPNSYVITTVGEDKWTAGKISRDEMVLIENIKPQLIDSFQKIQQLKDNDHSDYILFQLINRNIYSLAVLNEIEKLLIQYKSENNVLHISEFNKMIAKIVLNEPIPFIYERLGERYNNYLIDEFQDTSVLQFQNLLPLIDNSLAHGHFTMLVGDGKQAIYRWRGGEVEQFAMLPEIFSHKDNPLVLEREEALKRNHNPEVLKSNFRSKREIIEFNNHLFRTLSGRLNQKYQNIYDNLEQVFNPENTGGFVQVEFLDEQQEEWRERNFQRTHEIIMGLLAENFRLKDIAILVRKNTDGSDIANYLTKNNIPVISSDSLLLSNSRDVNFLHAILKFLSNTNDDIVHAEILEFLSTSGYITDGKIDELITRKNASSLAVILRTVSPEFNIPNLSKLALYELMEELIRLFRLNQTPNAYIQFYLDEVLNYSIKKNNNLNDFIEYWEEKKDKASLVTPQGMDAVSIMTIHRSKGLEFPVVILPFSNGKVKHGKDNLWIDLENEKLEGFPSALVPTSESLNETQYGELYEEEKSKSLLDSLNVMYVAFTRPEERMYIIADKPSKNPGNMGKTSDMLAFYYQSIGEWEEGKTIYTFGVGNPPKHKTEIETSNFKLQTFNSNQWRESIKMRSAAPSIWNTNMAETKKDYGVMVHTALARIRYDDEIEKALNSMLAEGMINNEESEHLSLTIAKIMKLPQLADHFKKGVIVKNEAEVISVSGEMLRPDRVVINNKNAVIIDYKTGAKKQKHQQQIIEYGDLLQQMGYLVTDKLLVYIEEMEIVEVK